MAHIETEEELRNLRSNKKSPRRKRRIRPIPLTSKIPLYNKLLAEKEERCAFIHNICDHSLFLNNVQHCKHCYPLHSFF